MFETRIVCRTCGEEYPLKTRLFRCKKCNGSLEVTFNYDKLGKRVDQDSLRGREFRHDRYAEFYPVRKTVSIGEGGTPLLKSSNIKHKLRLGFDLLFKNESVNPTGSFKDRGSSVEIAKSLEFRSRNVVCASTGNMGASVSAYSGIAGLSCHIFIPEDAKPVKIKQMLGYGAKVYRVEGDYSQTARLAEKANRDYGAFLLGDYLYRREGTKSVGFEIADQLDFKTRNSYVVVPVGNGILMSGIWKAFREFRELDLIKHLPRLVGIQAEGCSPVTKAFRKGTSIKPVKNPRTVAGAIECGDPFDGDSVLDAVKGSRGFMESVSDGEILDARETLAKEEGLFAEPAGAVSLAGLIKAKKHFPRKSRVICLVTGHGLKTPRTDIKGSDRRIGSGPDVLEKLFG